MVKNTTLFYTFLAINVPDYIVFTHHVVLEVSLLGELSGAESTLEVLLVQLVLVVSNLETRGYSGYEGDN